MPPNSVVELLSSICRFADAVGFPRGGSLASLPPDLKLPELSRLVRELNDALTYELDSNTAGGTVILMETPQARVALIQLHAAALRLATDPWDARPGDVGGAAANLGAPGVPQKAAAVGSTRAASSNTRRAAGIGSGAPFEEDVLEVLTETSKLLGFYLCFIYHIQPPPVELLREHFSALLRAHTIPVLTRFVIATTADGRNRSIGNSSSRSSVLADMRREAAVKLFDVVRHLMAAADCNYLLRAELMDTFSSSGLLEHLAKAAAPRAAAKAAAAATAPGPSPLGSRATHGGGSGSIGDGVVSILPYALHGIMGHLGHWETPPPSLRAVLSGPCLQFFATAQAVSQLHAADGGPLYGLPYDALMLEMQDPEREGCSSIPRPGRQQQEGPPVSSTPVARAITFWQACLAHEPPVPLRPLRRRHLVALCLRAARVALDSVDVHRQGQRQQQEPHQHQHRTGPHGNSGGPANAGGGRELRPGGGLRRPFEQEGCCALALNALETVVVLRSSSRSSSKGGGGEACAAAAPLAAARPDPRLHHAPFAARWWPLAVRCVRAMLRRQQQLQYDALPGGVWAHYFSRCGALLQLHGHADEGALTGWHTGEAVGDQDGNMLISEAYLTVFLHRARTARHALVPLWSRPDASHADGVYGFGMGAETDNRLCIEAQNLVSLGYLGCWSALRKWHPFQPGRSASDSRTVVHCNVQSYTITSNHRLSAVQQDCVADRCICHSGFTSSLLADSCHVTPPAGLPHALSAGYMPTYEALLRAACRDAERMLPTSTARGSTGISVMDARKATRLLRSLLLVAPGSKLLLLLGEGHRREAAALATTLCKAHLQHAQLAAWLRDREGLAEAARMATGLSRVFRTGMTAQADGAAAISTATGSSSSSDSGSGGHDGGGGGGELSGRSSCSRSAIGVSGRVFPVSGQRIYPVDIDSSSKQRLMLLSHMLPRLLPVMTHIGALCFAGGLGGTAELEELAIARHQLLQFAANGARLTVQSCGNQAAKGSWLQLERDTIAADLVGPGGLVAAVGASQRARTDAGGPGEAQDDGECKLGGSAVGDGGGEGEGQQQQQQEQQWVELVPHAPCIAAQVLRTCSNPLCVNMRGHSEASVSLEVPAAGSGAWQPAAGSGGRAGRPLASPLGVEGEVKRFCLAACCDSQQEQLKRLRAWEKEDVDCRNCRWCCAMRGKHTRG